MFSTKVTPRAGIPLTLRPPSSQHQPVPPQTAAAEDSSTGGGKRFGTVRLMGLLHRMKDAVVRLGGGGAGDDDDAGEPDPYAHVTIGRPTDFKHEAHLGLDVRSPPICPVVVCLGVHLHDIAHVSVRICVVQPSSISGEWKAILRNAGIKPKELKDTQFASFLVGVIDQIQAEGTHHIPQTEPMMERPSD